MPDAVNPDKRNAAWGRIIGLFILLMALAGGGWWYYHQPAKSATPVAAVTEPAKPAVAEKDGEYKCVLVKKPVKKPATVRPPVVVRQQQVQQQVMAAPPVAAKQLPTPVPSVVVESPTMVQKCAGTGQCQSQSVNIVTAPATVTAPQAPPPAAAPATPAPVPQPQQSTAPSGTAVIFANIAIDDGSGKLLPPIQGLQLGALVRSGMAAGTLQPPSQPMKFVVEIGGKQYTAVSRLVPWRLNDGRVVQAMQARVEVDEATARAHRGLVKSWVTGLNGEPVKFLNPPNDAPSDGVYRSLPDELAKLAAQGGKMMFHFVLPSHGANARSVPLQPPPPPVPQS